MLDLENSQWKVREDITCYMSTLIIDDKTSIIYGLDMFFISEKYIVFKLLPKNSFFVK